MNLRNKVLVGYFILVVLIGFMASILIHERHRISEIDLQNSGVQQAIRDIHNVHRYITRLTMLGESVIDWNRTDCSHYRIQRLCTDSLLQALKFHCAAYVYPAQMFLFALYWQAKRNICGISCRYLNGRKKPTVFW